MPQAAPTPVPTERLHLAMPPQHSSPEEARRHRKERLAAALRLFGRMGFEEGVAGHITARDPEFTDCCWVNPFGMPFGHVAVSDLILVNQDGQVLEGRRHVNQAAFVVHSRVHAARPTSSPSSTAIRRTAGPSRRWANCSTRSPRTRAPSTRTTRCWTGTRA